MQYRRDIVLHTEELIQDITNHGYIQSGSASRPKGAVQLKDIAEFNNKEAVVRYMDLAADEVVNALYPYSVDTWSRGMMNTLVCDEYKEAECYAIHLTFGWVFPDTTLRYIKNLAHNFIVWKVLQWFLEEAFSDEPNLAAVWEKKADDALDKIIKNRTKGMKNTYRPAWPKG